MNEWELPKLLAMLTCVDFKKAPGGYDLMSVFTYAHSDEYPLEFETLCVFLEMSGGRGSRTMKIELVAPNGEVTEQAEMPVNFDDPAAQSFLALKFLNAKIPTPGFYRVVLYLDGQYVDERKLYFS